MPLYKKALTGMGHLSRKPVPVSDHPRGKETLPKVKSEPPPTPFGTIATLCSWEDPTNYRPLTLSSAPGKMMEKILLGATGRHFKDNAITRHSQQGFTKPKQCLTKLMSFYSKVTHLVGAGKAVEWLFWILLRLLILSLTASLWTSCPAVR